MAKRNRFFVSPGKGKSWQVKKQGSSRPVSNHRTKDAAVERGRKEAKAAKPGQLVIQKRDGKIQEERTYGQDPHPPKG